MKMSAWIRFCLIVLCLAMACSMFACRNPEEQTTEKPEQVTTEAPSVEKPTEQPTEKPTETPTTEAPVTETTEAPATETTEAPVTETTEAPATETTEAPATETTEAPATETTEEVTNTYLEEETIVIGGIEYVEEAASPYAYNIDSHGGAPGQTIIATADNFNQVVSGLKGWIAIRPGILKYVYAIVVDGVQGEWIDFTKTQLPDGSNTVGYNRSDVITHIGNNFPGFEKDIAGTNCGFNFTHTIDLSQYHGKDVSIVYYAVVYKVDAAGDRALDADGNGIEGAWIHMATAIDVMPEHYGVGGYRDNGDGTHSIKCEGCNEYYITEACNPAFGSGATAKDTNTHTGMTCGLCHQTGIEGPHSVAANPVWDDAQGKYTTLYNNVVWDDAQGKYISVCIACGGQSGDAFGAVNSVELENLNIGQPSWATSQSNEETYAVITMGEHMQNGSPSGWKAAYFKVNPNALRTGQYVAIRYMIPDTNCEAETFGLELIAVNADVPVIADGQWHVVVIYLNGKDASFAIPAGDTRLNFNTARGWEKGDQIYLDWIKTYDDIARIPDDGCECPNWAIEVVEYAGIERHSVRCTICGREDTAAHTPSSTHGVAVEGGYVKACTVCGGATAESAMGLYVFGKDELAALSPKGGDDNKEVTENGVKFTNSGNEDSFLSVFTSNTKKTGKYFFIKYKANNLTRPQFYIWPGPTNAYTPAIDNDGEWHIAVVAVNTETVQELRLDIESETSDIAWIEIAYLGYADDAAALANALKTAEGDNATTYVCGNGCQAVFNKNVIIDDATHGVKCAICDTTLSTEAHVWASTDCATVMPACSCGKEKGVLGHTVAGSDGEYCSTCFNFLKVDDVSKYFAYFWGGKNAPNATSGAYKGQDAVTGYNVYTTTKTDYRHQLISTTETVAGRYLVVKYLLVDGTMQFGLFASTKQTGINGSYFYNHVLVNNGTGDGWRYIIVDLVESIGSSGVAKAEDGSAYLQHLTVDYDLSSGSTATAQFAYVAVAATLEDAIAGIKAIDGVEKIDSTCCFCPSFCLEGTYVDEYKHVPVCKLCGKQGEATAHVGADHGVWNEELNDYYTETPCTACGEIYCYGATVKMTDAYMFGNARPWGHFECTWTGNSWKLKKLPATEYNWVQGHLYINPNDNVTGQYLLIKYIATGHPDYYDVPFAVGSIASQASSNTSLHFIFDNTPRYIILDLSTLANYTPNADGTYSYEHNDAWRMDFVGLTKDAVIEFLDISMYDAMDRIPAIAQADCPHPTFALQGDEIDAETHGSICQLCNKVLETESHTYPATAVYSSELGYYANACTICGHVNRAMANIVYTTDYVKSGNLTITPTEDGIKFEQTEHIDANVTFFCNEGSVETGKYLFFKYRTSGDVTSFEVYTSTSEADAAYRHSFGPALDLTEGWHLAIIDVTTTATTFNASEEDGKYYAKHLRFDIEDGVGKDGCWMEIAYVGYANDIDALVESLQYFDADIDVICPCEEILATVVSNGVETHSLTCKLCGTAGDPVAHTPAYGIWDEELGYYAGVCGICGTKSEIDYGCTVGFEAETKTIAQPGGWNTSQTTSGDGTYITITGSNPGWSATYCPINPDNVVSGQYFVFRYRVNTTVGGTESMLASLGTVANVSWHYIPLELDGEWHVMIFNLSDNANVTPNGPNGEYIVTNGNQLVFNSFANKYTVDFDWFKMFDSYDRIPDAYKPVVTE